MRDPAPHRQHCEMPSPTPQRPRRGGLRWTIVAVVLLVLILAVAQRLDSTAAAEDAARTDLLIQRMQQQRIDQLWAQRVADAYAKGRQEALHPEPASPEVAFLVSACAALASVPYRQP